jgi:hypothetical protein
MRAPLRDGFRTVVKARDGTVGHPGTGCRDGPDVEASSGSVNVLTMRTAFALYLAIIIAGIAFFTVVGLVG